MALDDAFDTLDLPDGVSLDPEVVALMSGGEFPVPEIVLDDADEVLGDELEVALDGGSGDAASGALLATDGGERSEGISADEVIQRNVHEHYADQHSDVLDNTLLKAAGTTAVAVALATTLATAPIDAEKAQLPEPIPIVQVYAPPTPDQPPASPDDQADDSVSVKQKILKLLKYALVVVVLAGACVIGASQAGCTACSGMVGIPFLSGADNTQSQ